MSPHNPAWLKALLPTMVGDHRYCGESQDLGFGHIFGGQILAQGLWAAAMSMPEDRPVHSLHAYFLQLGKTDLPVEYQVSLLRHGKSFSCCSVMALQKDQCIASLMVSAHKSAAGLQHQAAMPICVAPDELLSDWELVTQNSLLLPPLLRPWLQVKPFFEHRFVSQYPSFLAPPSAQVAPTHYVWLRICADVEALPGHLLHTMLLAYLSDHHFLNSALLPHGLCFFSQNVQMASLDHAMWFHAPFASNDWLLFCIETPVALDSRALVLGKFFTNTGKLVAHAAQEGLVRLR